MKKTELLNKLADVIEEIEHIETYIDELGSQLKSIRRRLENLPSEPEEIEEDEKEDE